MIATRFIGNPRASGRSAEQRGCLKDFTQVVRVKCRCMSLLLGIFLIQALPSVANVSCTVSIDSEHTLILIGGRKMNDRRASRGSPSCWRAYLVWKSVL